MSESELHSSNTNLKPFTRRSHDNQRVGQIKTDARWCQAMISPEGLAEECMKLDGDGGKLELKRLDLVQTLMKHFPERLVLAIAVEKFLSESGETEEKSNHVANVLVDTGLTYTVIKESIEIILRHFKHLKVLMSFLGKHSALLELPAISQTPPVVPTAPTTLRRRKLTKDVPRRPLKKSTIAPDTDRLKKQKEKVIKTESEPVIQIESEDQIIKDEGNVKINEVELPQILKPTPPIDDKLPMTMSEPVKKETRLQINEPSSLRYLDHERDEAIPIRPSTNRLYSRRSLLQDALNILHEIPTFEQRLSQIAVRSKSSKGIASHLSHTDHQIFAAKSIKSMQLRKEPGILEHRRGSKLSTQISKANFDSRLDILNFTNRKAGKLSTVKSDEKDINKNKYYDKSNSKMEDTSDISGSKQKSGENESDVSSDTKGTDSSSSITPLLEQLIKLDQQKISRQLIDTSSSSSRSRSKPKEANQVIDPKTGKYGLHKNVHQSASDHKQMFSLNVPSSLSVRKLPRVSLSPERKTSSKISMASDKYPVAFKPSKDRVGLLPKVSISRDKTATNSSSSTTQRTSTQKTSDTTSTFITKDFSVDDTHTLLARRFGPQGGPYSSTKDATTKPGREISIYGAPVRQYSTVIQTSDIFEITTTDIFPLKLPNSVLTNHQKKIKKYLSELRRKVTRRARIQKEIAECEKLLSSEMELNISATTRIDIPSHVVASAVLRHCDIDTLDTYSMASFFADWDDQSVSNEAVLHRAFECLPTKSSLHAELAAVLNVLKDPTTKKREVVDEDSPYSGEQKKKKLLRKKKQLRKPIDGESEDEEEDNEYEDDADDVILDQDSTTASSKFTTDSRVSNIQNIGLFSGFYSSPDSHMEEYWQDVQFKSMTGLATKRDEMFLYKAIQKKMQPIREVKNAWNTLLRAIQMTFQVRKLAERLMTKRPLVQPPDRQSLVDKIFPNKLKKWKGWDSQGPIQRRKGVSYLNDIEQAATRRDILKRRRNKARRESGSIEETPDKKENPLETALMGKKKTVIERKRQMAIQGEAGLPTDVPVEDSEDQKKLTKEYLTKWNIPGLFQSLTEALLVERPDDPVAFVHERVKVMQTFIRNAQDVPYVYSCGIAEHIRHTSATDVKDVEKKQVKIKLPPIEP